MASDYRQNLKYLEAMRTIYGNTADIICGYETDGLGFTLYHQLTDHNVNCEIFAPAAMMESVAGRKLKRINVMRHLLQNVLLISPIVLFTFLQPRMRKFDGQVRGAFEHLKYFLVMYV